MTISALFLFIEVFGDVFNHISLKVPPQHFKLVELRTLSHYNTLILFQSFCCSCASFSYCVIQLALTVRQITFDCWMILYTEDHMADSLTESFPGPVASKQTQIVIFQPPNWQLVWSVQIIFSLNATVWAKITTLVSFCPKDIVLEVLWFIQIQSKPKLCSYVLFRK